MRVELIGGGEDQARAGGRAGSGLHHHGSRHGERRVGGSRRQGWRGAVEETWKP